MIQNVFLGKGGKVYGPYTESEFNQMFSKGELATFHWKWNWKNETWEPMDVMPPPPPSVAGSRSVSSSNTVGKSKRGGVDWTQVESICFDHLSALSGKIDSVTESGCEFVVSGADHVRFSVSSQVNLGLTGLPGANEFKNKNVSVVPASVVNISKLDKSIVYRLRWKGVPVYE